MKRVLGITCVLLVSTWVQAKTSSRPAPKPKPAPPPAVDAGPPTPAGTWVVEKVSSSDDASSVGMTWVVTSKALSLIRDGEIKKRLACELTAMDEGNWALECGETTLVWLPVGTGWTARQGATKTQLRKATSVEAAAAAKVVKQSDLATGPACARAKRCCEEAMPLAGSTCGPDELPRQELASECNKMIETYRQLLQKAGKTAPKSCGGPP